MVKPPKGMQPEYFGANMNKAGRASGKAFKEDSFRNYMARKIDMQRKQFGLVIPPDPREMKRQKQEEEETQQQLQHHQQEYQQQQKTPLSSKKKIARVRFSDDVKDNGGAGVRKLARRKKNKKGKAVMSSVLQSLQQRHGDRKKKGHHHLQSRRDKQKNNEGELIETDDNIKDVKIKSSDAGMDAGGVYDSNREAVESTKPQGVTQFVSFGKEEGGGDTIASPDQDSSIVVADGSVDFSDSDANLSPLSRSPLPQIHRRLRPDLFFSGIVVMVNGYTNPDDVTLLRLLHKHGGDMEKYETSRVTHIIAEHLSAAKANIYKRQRKPLPVCKPAWILDCVQARRLIPHGDYLIDEVRGDKNNLQTKSVKSFFSPASDTTTPKSDYAGASPKRKHQCPGSVSGLSNDRKFMVSSSPTCANPTKTPEIFDRKEPIDNNRKTGLDKTFDDFIEDIESDSSQGEDSITSFASQRSIASANLIPPSTSLESNAIITTQNADTSEDQVDEETHDHPSETKDSGVRASRDSFPIDPVVRLETNKYPTIYNSVLEQSESHADINNETNSIESILGSRLLGQSKADSNQQFRVSKETGSYNAAPSKSNLGEIHFAGSTDMFPFDEKKKVDIGCQSIANEIFADDVPGERSGQELSLNKELSSTYKRIQLPTTNDENIFREGSGCTWSKDTAAETASEQHDVEPEPESKQPSIEPEQRNIYPRYHKFGPNESSMEKTRTDKPISGILTSAKHTDLYSHSHLKPAEENEIHLNSIDDSGSQSQSCDSRGLATAPQSPSTTEIIEEEGKAIAGPKRNDEKYINGQIRTVGNDPNFLESFFNSSRLSFIGSYKQRIKQSSEKVGSWHAGDSVDNGGTKRFVFHVDMDCFFVAVALRNFPQYHGKPIAVSHHGRTKSNSNEILYSKTSTSECATCNYEARKFGVEKGMFLGRAKELCPDLIVLHYDFEGYEEVAEQVSSILHRYCDDHGGGELEQVSCDESYIELCVPLRDDQRNNNLYERVGDIANDIRKEIFETTRCTASVGVGPNKFLAKLSTDRVKPNGCFVVRDSRELLENLYLRDLHGVGYRTDRKLMSEGLTKVQDVWNLGERAEKELCRILGPGLGKKIFAFCSGKDDRPVKPAERRTIGAECNYGVRFNGTYGVDHMIAGLAKEVEKRMTQVGVRGRHLTLKIKQRKQGAKPPPKFLGHGSCHNISKSIDTSHVTRDWKILSRLGTDLYTQLSVPVSDIRGMGIIISKLVKDDDADVRQFDNKGNSELTAQSITKFFGNNCGGGRKGIDDEERASKIKHLVCSEQEKVKPDARQSEVEVFSSTFTSASCIHKSHCGGKKEALDVSSVKNRPLHPVGVAPSVATRAGNNDRVGDFDWRPTFSQIDKEIFSNLPEEIQQEIIAESSLVVPRTDDSRSTLTRPNTESTSFEIIEVESSDDSEPDDPIGEQPVHNSQASEDIVEMIVPPKYRTDMNEAPAPPSLARKRVSSNLPLVRTGSFSPSSAISNIPGEGTNSRYRQVSVKRMLRLASVKSRRENISSIGGETVSLTQLDCLPLELQLQVANSDDVVIGQLSQPSPAKATGRKRRQSATSFKKNIGSASSFESSEVPENNDVSFPRKRSREENNGAKCEEKIVESETMLSNNNNSFYQDNVAPFKLFMDENPRAEGDAVERVIEFLGICVTERRLHDAVVLLRNMKNRGDLWSREAYQQISVAIDDKCTNLLKISLDKEWLSL